jgi:hypothetical protein
MQEVKCGVAGAEFEQITQSNEQQQQILDLLGIKL